MIRQWILWLILLWAPVRLTQAQLPITPLGAGTEADPFQITELGHLVWIGENVGTSFDNYYSLLNDIDAAATTNWNGGAGFAPIGTNGASPFFGVFDGNYNTIRHLHINRPGQEYVGLFGVLGGAAGWIKNLGLVDCAVSGSNGVGGIAGDLGGGASISSCFVTGVVTGKRYVGGIAGYLGGDAIVSRCSASAVVSAEGICIGGLVGGGAMGDTIIDKCYATGAVSGKDNVGGLVGMTDGSGNTIQNSFAAGTVTGTGGAIGGLVGSFLGTVTNCYAAGSVTGLTGVGGLVGMSGFSINLISGSYARGAVSGGGSHIGGLVGLNNGTVTNSFWDTQTSGRTTSAGGTGKTTAQMKLQATFVGWDFVNVWRIIDDLIYPHFRPQGIAALPPAIVTCEVNSGDKAVLRWRGIEEHIYTVYHSTNLAVGFSVLRTNILATPPANAYTDNVNGVAAKFWSITTEE